MTDLRNADRVNFETKVHLEFEKFSGFITEYSHNISRGGMFIRSDEPLAIGTVLSFEFKLKDNFDLIQGLGEVCWVRSHSSSPKKPAGMGIKFREISEQSKELIDTMVQNAVKAGHTAFDIDSPPDDAEFDPSKEDIFDEISSIGIPEVNTNEETMVIPTAAQAGETPSPKNDDSLSDLFEAIEVDEGPSHIKIDATSNPETQNFEALFDLPDDTEAEDTAPQPIPPSGGSIVNEVLEGSAHGKGRSGLAVDEEEFQPSPGQQSPDETFHLKESFGDSSDQKPVRKSRTYKFFLFLIVLVGLLFVANQWVDFRSVPVIGSLFESESFSLLPTNTEKTSVSGEQVVSQVEEGGGESAAENVAEATSEEALADTSAEGTPAATTEDPTPSDTNTPIHSDDLSTTSEAQSTSPSTPENKAPVSVSEAAKKKATEEEKTTKQSPEPPAEKAEASLPPVSGITSLSSKMVDGVLEVTLKGNGAFNTSRIKNLSLRSGKPREVVIIPGITEPFSNQNFTIGTGGVSRARSGYHPEKVPAELHLVFDLTDPQQKIESLRAEEDALIIRFK